MGRQKKQLEASNHKKTHLISASCIQEIGRLDDNARGSNSALPAGRSESPSTASTKGTDADFLIVHFAGTALEGLKDVAVESEDEKERTGREALTKANMLALAWLGVEMISECYPPDASGERERWRHL